MSAPLTMKERVRAALAEAGYPNAKVTGPDDAPNVLLGTAADAVPDRVCWMAFYVAGFPEQACWPCWSEGYECTHVLPLDREENP